MEWWTTSLIHNVDLIISRTLGYPIVVNPFPSINNLLDLVLLKLNRDEHKNLTHCVFKNLQAYVFFRPPFWL